MNRDINFDIDLGEDVEINIEATGFSSSYQDLTNKPKINNVEVNGDKTSSDFNIYSKDDVNNLLYFKADKSELEDYVKFTDKATTYDFGIVKPDGNTIKINDNGTLGVVAGQGDPSNYQNLVGKPQINNVTLEGGNTDSDTLDLVKKSKLQKEKTTLNTNEDNRVDINYGEIVVNGKYSQNTTTGKNLFNINGDVNTKYNGNISHDNIVNGNDLTSVTDANQTHCPGQKIYVGVGNKITFSAKIKTTNPIVSSGAIGALNIYNDNTTSGRATLNLQYSDVGLTKSITFTPTSDYIYVCFGRRLNVDTITFTDIQVEFGNAVTSYEKYTGGQPSPSPDYPQEITTINTVSLKLENDSIETTVPINLQNNELCSLPNGTKDELVIENENVKIIKRVGKVVLNGSENLTQDRELRNSFRYYTSSIINGNNNISLSNYFVNKSSNYINSNDEQALTVINNRQIIMRINKNIASSTTELKSWLQTHNTTVYYELATPTTIDLGTITNINFKDYNSISVLTNLNSTYKLISYNKDFDYINLLSDKIESNKSRITTLNNNIVNKVDKVEGKGLSSNDFTNDDKNNLDLNTENRHNHANKSVLDSITTSMITKLNNISVNTLWTNPDTTLNFPSQQVTLSDSLENYNLLVIIIRDSTQDTNYHTTIIAKNDDIFEDYYDRRYVENVGATRMRKYGAVTNTMYSFTNSTDTEGTSRSGSLVPVKIIGIKL